MPISWFTCRRCCGFSWALTRTSRSDGTSIVEARFPQVDPHSSTGVRLHLRHEWPHESVDEVTSSRCLTPWSITRLAVTRCTSGITTPPTALPLLVQRNQRAPLQNVPAKNLIVLVVEQIGDVHRDPRARAKLVAKDK